MYYQEMVNDVAEPWRQFLRKTSLKQVNETMLLVVPRNEEPLYISVKLLQVIYNIGKKLYPEATSLSIVAGDEYDFIEQGILELVDIRYIQ